MVINIKFVCIKIIMDRKKYKILKETRSGLVNKKVRRTQSWYLGKVWTEIAEDFFFLSYEKFQDKAKW